MVRLSVYIKASSVFCINHCLPTYMSIILVKYLGRPLRAPLLWTVVFVMCSIPTSYGFLASMTT